VLLGDAAGERGGFDALGAGPLTLPSPTGERVAVVALPLPLGEGRVRGAVETGAAPGSVMRAMVWPTGMTSPSCA